jgi:Leucine-rich repeat (LRR) protein
VIRWNRYLSPLSSLTNLRYLDAHANLVISDISPLAGLVNMEMLIIRDNRISDISALSGMTKLEHLYLEWNNISDISPLSGLTNLQGISLQYNDIADVSPLSSLTNLDYVDIRGNPLNADACVTHIPQIIANNPGITIEYNSCARRRVVLSSRRADPSQSRGRRPVYDNGEIIF